MPTADIYSPEPNTLERKCAVYLARNGADTGAGAHPSRGRVEKISRVTKWVIGLSALAGIVSGGLIGGGEVWMRYGVFDGMEDIGWRESWPYWLGFYAFVGVISAVEIAFLYGLTLKGIDRITQHSGLPLSRSDGQGLLAHSLARAAMEFPNPQVRIYGIDPYAHVANWKLTALNIAYKMKVGVSSFVLRVFLRRVGARMAIRGIAPLSAGPLYAFWNAFIVWRIMAEARLRTLGPFAVDNLMTVHFQDGDKLADAEKEVILHAAGEMLTRGRDAHPNQFYLLSRLRDALKQDEDIKLDWTTLRRHLTDLDAAGQTRVLDVLTVSCVIGTRIHREQTALLRGACEDCGAVLDTGRLKDLHKALRRGDEITDKSLADTRSEAGSGAA